MIGIKSLKPDSARVPSTLEIYRGSETEAAPSRWPAVAMLALAAVALYLKNLFPGLAKSDLGPPAEPAKSEAGGDPALQAMDDGDEKQPEDETGSLGEKDDPVIGSGGPGPTVGGIADFMGIDSPAIDYEQLPLPRHIPSVFELGFGRDRAGNDNIGMASFGSGSSAPQVGSPGSRRDLEDMVDIGKGPNLPVVVGPFPPVIVRPDPDPGPGGDDGEIDIPEHPVQRNRAPRVSGPVALGEIGICKSFLITVVALLAGASDADADPLSIVNLRASSGELVAVEGGWEFKPAAGYYGPVTLTYEINDGEASITQSASLGVVEFVELIGTPGDDDLVGTECADLIDGRDGNDTIDARGGSDIVFGSGGTDIISAGAGHDLIYAGRGDDVVHGGPGNDTIHGGAGNDKLHGDDGDDIINGDDGDDLIVGGAGNDQLAGGAGNDAIQGDDGDDTISGGPGDDVAEGGDGADAIEGGAGCDTLSGGAGNDHVTGDAGNDIISGDDGDDIMDGGDGDNEIDAGEGNDIVFTGNGNNRVTTGGGNNTVTGGSGADQIQAGAGQDVVQAGGGGDTIGGGGGDDRLFGEAGDDTIFGEDGDDVMSGGDGADHLGGGNGNDSIDGGDGKDIIEAGAGDDSVKGGDGDDIVLAAAGCDWVDGGNGNDKLFGAAGDDHIEGGVGNDTIDAGTGEDIVKAGAGDDVIVAALDGEDDCYDGGSGTDTLDLSQAQCDVDVDMVEGTAIGIEIGADKVFDLEEIIGGDGDDNFTVGAEAMTLTGGEGDDTFTFDVSCDDDDRELIHEILDLQAGDRIIIKQYEIRSERDDDPNCDDDRDPFDSTYGEGDDTGQPFRFRIEKIGEDDWTFVDVYIEQQDEKDFSIEILGSHRLYYY